LAHKREYKFITIQTPKKCRFNSQTDFVTKNEQEAERECKNVGETTGYPRFPRKPLPVARSFLEC